MEKAFQPEGRASRNVLMGTVWTVQRAKKKKV